MGFEYLLRAGDGRTSHFPFCNHLHAHAHPPRPLVQLVMWCSLVCDASRVLAFPGSNPPQQLPQNG